MKCPPCALLLQEPWCLSTRLLRKSHGKVSWPENVRILSSFTPSSLLCSSQSLNLPYSHLRLVPRREECILPLYLDSRRSFTVSSGTFGPPENGRKVAESAASPMEERKSLPDSVPLAQEQKPMTNWEKFKDMYKKYWYVLIPVHGILCVGFMVILYYIVKSGVDVVPLLEKLGLPEKIIGPVRKSGTSAYIAAAYAIYHLISPLRYAVTLGLTTLTITYLKRFGYIKPVPSSKRMKEIYKESKERVEVFSRRLTATSKSRNSKK